MTCWHTVHTSTHGGSMTTAASGRKLYSTRQPQLEWIPTLQSMFVSNHKCFLLVAYWCILWQIISLSHCLLSKAQIPLCHLPRDLRDKGMMSPLVQIPLCRLPQNFPGWESWRNGNWAKGDVTGLSRTSRGTQRSGIWP